MFCPLIEIIEEWYVDSIEIIFFILAGHTHNILDQWFGVLAATIRKANFIGSFIALYELYRIAHDESSRKLRLKRSNSWKKRYASVANEFIHIFARSRCREDDSKRYWQHWPIIIRGISKIDWQGNHAYDRTPGKEDVSFGCVVQNCATRIPINFCADQTCCLILSCGET
jgi:hypothetical protein